MSENEKDKQGWALRYLKRLIESDRMLWGVGLASFLESTVLPIPLETILFPLMQARRDRMLLISLVVLLGCLLGATAGYAVGYFLFDAVGQWIVDRFSSEEQFDTVMQRMDESGFAFVFSVGVTPLPFQIAMLAAGATKLSFVTFITAAALSRGLRYFGLALLVFWLGDRAESLYRRYQIPVAVGLALVVVVFWIF
ncbi:VTT domain-containing protein [Pelagicoccus sp. SDUM812003]|uniref:YqaA family protein n=1 Tax=Pelagicoccus sp. SDUM812003 TaxID=3041267 RepID=UPI00280D8A47|nr:VTT domain-containing protein [Pelagicoccus sp. SDUM812003]MDQ8203836.1 VTT domain-containing protein [Pelagicoccus sp. SDUM812003]